MQVREILAAIQRCMLSSSKCTCLREQGCALAGICAAPYCIHICRQRLPCFQQTLQCTALNRLRTARMLGVVLSSSAAPSKAKLFVISNTRGCVFWSTDDLQSPAAAVQSGISGIVHWWHLRCFSLHAYNHAPTTLPAADSSDDR